MKLPTQRRCKGCGQIRKMKWGAHYCSDKCRVEARIREYMQQYDLDEETAAHWAKFDGNLEKPTGWHCHDCGKPSSQYRCPACKRKFLKANGYGDVAKELEWEDVLEDA